jgi:hypothetical protein
MVDMWATADQSRLRYMQFNQPKLRAELYSGLEDAIHAADDNLELNDLGQCVVLPSSYIGGPRHMGQRFQDSMAIARYYRTIDLFVTVTTNDSSIRRSPLWERIEVLRLHRNMRLESEGQDEQEFASWLLDQGYTAV